MSHNTISSTYIRSLSYSKARRFILLFGLVALFIATALLIYANTQRKNDQLLTTRMVENHLELGRQNFQDTLNSVVKDALFLAQIPGIHEFLRDSAD